MTDLGTSLAVPSVDRVYESDEAVAVYELDEGVGVYELEEGVGVYVSVRE